MNNYDEYIDPMTPLIETIAKDITYQFDGEVMRAVQEVGIVVDKDRLVQALTDAKKFYEEGNITGRNSVYRHGEWKDSPHYECLPGTDAPLNYLCSLCGHTSVENDNYCGNCGAKMDKRSEDNG